MFLVLLSWGPGSRELFCAKQSLEFCLFRENGMFRGIIQQNSLHISSIVLKDSECLCVVMKLRSFRTTKNQTANVYYKKVQFPKDRNKLVNVRRAKQLWHNNSVIASRF